jgi:hypothetical protein
MLDMQEYAKKIIDAAPADEMDQRGEKVAEAMNGCTGAVAIVIIASILTDLLEQMDDDAERTGFMQAVNIMTAAFQQFDANYRSMN